MLYTLWQCDVTIMNTDVSILTISYMCILPGVSHILSCFFIKLVILTILEQFENKK